jgi:serine/threonine protein kinase
MEIPVNSVIHDYVFLEKLGGTATSTVYKVQSSRFGLLFAAKVVVCADISKGKPVHRYAEAEIESLMQLNHPNIILLYDHFFESGAEFMILEFCPNGSLEEEVEASRGLELSRFASVAFQLLSALEYIHSHGISHRDIKPGNVLIDQHHRPKLADFGVAGPGVDSNSAGTWSYLAPEVLHRHASDRCKADIWALAVTFAYMIDGRLPWPLLPGQLVQAVSTGTFMIVRDIPVTLMDMLRHMFAVNPEYRWTAAQLKDHHFFAEQKQHRLDDVMPATGVKLSMSRRIPGARSVRAFGSQAANLMGRKLHRLSDGEGEAVTRSRPLLPVMNSFPDIV